MVLSLNVSAISASRSLILIMIDSGFVGFLGGFGMVIIVEMGGGGGGFGVFVL